MLKNRYHDHGFCDINRGIDKLIDKYKHDRDIVTNLIANDPNKLIATVWQHDGPLAIDNECRCRMGEGDRRSSYSCSQCKNLGRVKDFRSDQAHFSIGCGNHVGKTLIVSTAEVCKPMLNWDHDAYEKSMAYVNQYQKLATCGTTISNNIGSISGDQFTIRALLMWMLQKKFMEKGLPHMLNLYTAFICNNKGYSITDRPDFINIDDLDKNGYLTVSTVRSIIQQLLVSLLELQTVNFSHGNAGAHALVFMNEPVSYRYDKLHVEGTVTLKIVDLWQSSATFSNVHYFSKDIKNEMHVHKSVFVPEIENTTCKGNYCKTETISVYRLTDSTIDIYCAIRHQGTPLFVGSFDFYCFMVSLMTNKTFNHLVKGDVKLNNLWKEMFNAEDLLYVEERIAQYYYSDNEVAIDIIRGVWLRCDIVKHLFSIL